MKNDDFWKQQFGNEYHDRNRVEWKDRLPFWESAIDFCHPASVLEVGCGPAWNLRAIQSIDASIDCSGVDVNAQACEEARQAGFDVHETNALGILAHFDAGSVDLVFTAGVLIHIAPEDLEAAMRAIVRTSGRYVLAIEYEADQEVEVDYRGHAGKLWRRPYGALYQNMGLKLLSVGVAGGFDKCAYSLLEKAGSVE